ncbi:MAG: Holliday junction branch migration protein RuvA [Candidatus Kapaibacteriota bacterium]
MISTVRGKILEKKPTEVVIEANSIGFLIIISIKTFEKLPPVGSEVSLFTHLIPREDALNLYGFFTQQERTIFKLLLNVNGIGPKSAISILSSILPEELSNMIISGNSNSIQKVPGIGKKTAERLLLELKDKIISVSEIPSNIELSKNYAVREEAVEALIMLGYNRQTAEKCARDVLSKSNDSITTEELVKLSLQKLMK